MADSLFRRWCGSRGSGSGTPPAATLALEDILRVDAIGYSSPAGLPRARLRFACSDLGGAARRILMAECSTSMRCLRGSSGSQSEMSPHDVVRAGPRDIAMTLDLAVPVFGFVELSAQVVAQQAPSVGPPRLPGPRHSRSRSDRVNNQNPGMADFARGSAHDAAPHGVGWRRDGPCARARGRAARFAPHLRCPVHDYCDIKKKKFGTRRSGPNRQAEAGLLRPS